VRGAFSVGCEVRVAVDTGGLGNKGFGVKNSRLPGDQPPCRASGSRSIRT